MTAFRFLRCLALAGLVTALAACVPAPVRTSADASLLAAQAAHEATLAFDAVQQRARGPDQPGDEAAGGHGQQGQRRLRRQHLVRLQPLRPERQHAGDQQ